MSLSTDFVNDASNLCQDPETKGFDLQAGQSWIYPTNYSVRDYQYNIIQEALHKNTLVSLPTGLGKTFIAAVVMYNFYRWYPHDKIIFMAPTRPLVKQQMDACYNITAIPQEVTAELTGTKVQQSRTEIWQNKRVFFITPQVLQNDLAIIIELGAKIKCLVFDEAHRAKGNHAYCEVIRKLLPTNKLFRVLALSATPGNSSKDVLDVMQNLLIAHVEFRSEDSPDVKPYVFERALETVVVPLGEKLQQVKDHYIQILEKYTRVLIKYKVIYGNCSNLTKGKIFVTMKEFQAKNSGSRTPNYAEIMKSLNICLTLYHAYETLIRCGLRAFLNFYEEHIKNPLISGNMSLHELLNDVRNFLGPSADVQTLPDGTFTEVPATTKFGHPKLYKLEDILLTHFKHSEASSRVIVFFEYRESVAEAHALLSRSYPTVKARIFVGQGSGNTQKDQINTIKAFRDGNCNTLLSTCIGEEGLDVGDVDLIVCFDVANKSPIRMIQRMGRTGRKKEGRVIVLVTQGREQQTLAECLIYKNNLGNFVSNMGQLEQGKYKNNPKLIPSYIQPKCQKMYITVQKTNNVGKNVKKNGNLKNMFKKISDSVPKFDEVLDVIEIQERIKSTVENLWNKERPLESNIEESKIDFRKHLEKQRTFQTCEIVKHSKQTEIFVSLLQFADSKRFNLPLTQQLSQVGLQNRILKQGDIRSMFSKPVSNVLSQEYLPSQQGLTDKQKNTTHSFPPELFNEIAAYVSINTLINQPCKTCEFLFECPKIVHPTAGKIDFSTIIIPDVSVLDGITSKDFEAFTASLIPTANDLMCDLLEDENEIFNDVTFGEVSKTTPAKNTSMTYETPRNFDKILKSFQICENENDTQNVEETFTFEVPKSFKKILNGLDSETPTTCVKTVNTQSSIKKPENIFLLWDEIAAFFKLSSLADLFVDTEKESLEDLNATIIYTPPSDVKEAQAGITPDLFEESPNLFSSPEKGPVSPKKSESPILCSYERMRELKAKKQLFNESKLEELRAKPKLSNLKVKRNSFFESTRRDFSASKENPHNKPISADLGDICDLSTFISTESEKKKVKPIDLNDICDVSSFISTEKKESEPSTIKQKDKLDISELCDLSMFGLPSQKILNETKNITNEQKKSETWEEEITEAKKNSPVKELNIEDICDISNFFDETFEDSVKKSNYCSRIETLKEPRTTTTTIIKKTNQYSQLGVSKEQPRELNQFSDLDDFFDKSSFLVNTQQLSALEKSRVTDTKSNENNKSGSVIDLTDSDLEFSPVKTNPNVENKILSQLSITQMLSYVAKTDDLQTKSQKETTFTPRATQRPQSSASAKKTLQLKQDVASPKTSQIVKNKYNLTPRKNTDSITPKSGRSIVSRLIPADSDDEFEDMPASPIFAKPKAKVSQRRGSTKIDLPKHSKKRKRLCEFIDREAEVSTDEVVVVSEDEDSGEDCFEASFVADETQDFLNSTSTHARYLQSVRSPVVQRGGFKIPNKFRHNISNVFSQEVDNSDNTYLNDTFCVEDDVEVEGDDHNISELELLERCLKEKKQHKKRKKSEDKAQTKRRRIIVLNDDSD